MSDALPQELPSKSLSPHAPDTGRTISTDGQRSRRLNIRKVPRSAASPRDTHPLTINGKQISRNDFDPIQDVQIPKTKTVDLLPNSPLLRAPPPQSFSEARKTASPKQQISVKSPPRAASPPPQIQDFRQESPDVAKTVVQNRSDVPNKEQDNKDVSKNQPEEPTQPIKKKAKAKRDGAKAAMSRSPISGSERPDYKAMNVGDQMRCRIIFQHRFETLHQFNSRLIVPDTENLDLDDLHNLYQEYYRYYLINGSVRKYRAILVIVIMGVEQLFTKVFGMDMTGFAQDQLEALVAYEHILMELGEKYNGVGGGSWSPEFKLALLLLFNTALFLGARLLAGNSQTLDGFRKAFISWFTGVDVSGHAPIPSAPAPQPVPSKPREKSLDDKMPPAPTQPGMMDRIDPVGIGRLAVNMFGGKSGAGEKQEVKGPRIRRRPPHLE